jgi:hypothetical protein
MARKKKNLFYQHKKGEAIKYQGEVEPIPLSPALFSSGKLNLEIKASINDWNTLYLLAEAAPEYLGKLIKFYIAKPVYEEFLSREGTNLPRGLHNMEEQLFMDDARRYAAAAYTVLSHWAKRPLTDWPDDLKALIEQAEKILGEENIWVPPREIEKTLGKESVWPPKEKSPQKKSLDVTAVVRVLTNMKLGSRAGKLGLKNIEEMDNEIFSKLYLDKNKLEAANAFIQKYGSSMTVEDLYQVLPVFPWQFVKE